MKKIFSFILLFAIGIINVVSFSVPKIKKYSFASSSSYETAEREIFDIVSTDSSKLPTYLYNKSSTGITPYNEDTKERYEGRAITPAYDNYNQVADIFDVNEFSIDFDDSIFMWIFIPDESINNLEIKFLSTTNDTITFSYDFETLSIMLNDATVDGQLFGWRLFEFSLSDTNAKLEYDETNLYECVFNRMSINYKNAIGAQIKYSNNQLSFYHVYLAQKKLYKTNILKSNRYVYYETHNTLNYQLKNKYIGDELSFKGVSDIFSKLLVGKRDLLTYFSNDYEWKMVVKTPLVDDEEEMDFDDIVLLQDKGWTNISFKLYEYRNNSTRSINIFRTSYAVYVDEFKMGKFENTSYYLDKGENLFLTFTLSDEFVLTSDLSVYCSDKSIADITYYNLEGNVCSIIVTGKETGYVNLVVQANGYRRGIEYQEDYMMTNQLIVESYDEYSQTSIIIMWVVFGIYVIGLLIFVIISVVKARKFSVK